MVPSNGPRDVGRGRLPSLAPGCVPPHRSRCRRESARWPKGSWRSGRRSWRRWPKSWPRRSTRTRCCGTTSSASRRRRTTPCEQPCPRAPARPPVPGVSKVANALLIPCRVQWGRASRRTARSQAVGAGAEDVASRRIVFREGPKEGGVCD